MILYGEYYPPRSAIEILIVNFNIGHLYHDLCPHKFYFRNEQLEII